MPGCGVDADPALVDAAGGCAAAGGVAVPPPGTVVEGAADGPPDEVADAVDPPEVGLAGPPAVGLGEGVGVGVAVDDVDEVGDPEVVALVVDELVVALPPEVVALPPEVVALVVAAGVLA